MTEFIPSEYERVPAIARRTGLSQEAIRRRIRDGILPAVRIRGGKDLFVKREDVDALFEPAVTSA